MRKIIIITLLIAGSSGVLAPAHADPIDDTASVSTDTAASTDHDFSVAELLQAANALLGAPYHYGGDSPETGFDCSGLVRAVYAQIGQWLPRRADEQAATTQTISMSALRPGDLVFFNTLRRAFSHVGIYIGNGNFIHAPRPGEEVRIDNLNANYWLKHFDGARRVLMAQIGNTHITAPGN